MGYIGIIGTILGLYWDNGKENGNYTSIFRTLFGLGSGFMFYGVQVTSGRLWGDI